MTRPQRYPRRPDQDQCVNALESRVHRSDPRVPDDKPAAVDSRKYVRAGRSAMAAEAARLLTLFSVTDGENQR